MWRREFITLACASVVCPPAARAQQQAIPRIGYIWIGKCEGTDLPVEQATEVTLNSNLKTAKALGLNVLQALLATANEVIE